jgi:sporulation protein YlmC with PRC-barrel domain
MAHLGILGEYRFSDSEEAGADIRGASVYGLNDEKLGKIDDVIFDHATADIRYVVIDTGGWLSTKKFVVPADRLRMSAKRADEFEVDLDKAHVEKFPPYSVEDVESSRRWRSDHASRGDRPEQYANRHANDGNRCQADGIREAFGFRNGRNQQPDHPGYPQ